MIFFNFLEYYVEEIILFENIVLIKFIEIIYVLICMYFWRNNKQNIIHVKSMRDHYKVKLISTVYGL